MKVDLFDFDLPEELVAQHGAPRGTSRLMVASAPADERHRRVADLPDLLEPGDLLVVNDTRVIPARLYGRRQGGGGRVELLLTVQHGEREWDAMVRPGRRMRPGTVVTFDDGLEAEVTAVGEDGQRRLRFSDDVEPHLDALGHMPLPPYIQREDDAEDRERYQTVFARRPGAIAAPTAGLHFTPEILERLDERGVERAAVTLHVGLGTFKPVTAEDVADHRMHRERFEVREETAAAIRRLRERGGRLVAVGTTVVRTLESVVRDDGTVPAGAGSTEIFIVPGFRFRAVDRLLTNFHLPRSTLLMLVSAFAGRERVLDAYREAVEERYRFFSYGDAMLLDPFREPPAATSS